MATTIPLEDVENASMRTLRFEAAVIDLKLLTVKDSYVTASSFTAFELWGKLEETVPILVIGSLISTQMMAPLTSLKAQF